MQFARSVHLPVGDCNHRLRNDPADRRLSRIFPASVELMGPGGEELLNYPIVPERSKTGAVPSLWVARPLLCQHQKAAVGLHFLSLIAEDAGTHRAGDAA